MAAQDNGAGLYTAGNVVVANRVLARIAEHDGELATCAVVWHELRYGVARLPASKKRRAIETYLEEVVRTALPILPYDEESATWHARERARLGPRGRPSSAADGQIAATARVNELVLVTARPRNSCSLDRAADSSIARGDERMPAVPPSYPILARQALY